MVAADDFSIMSRPKRFMSLLVLFLFLGGFLLGCGCLTEQPGGGMPTTAVPTTSAPATTLDDLTFYTEQMPPYNYIENGTLQGITIDMLEAVSERMGSPVSRERVHLVPWSEGYQAALTGNNTVIFETARIPAREASFKWAGPVHADRYVVFARPEREIILDTPEALKDYRIGVVQDDAAIQQLMDVGVNPSQLVQEINASALVTLLQNGEIDVWVYGEAQGRYFSEQVLGDYNAFEVVYTFPDTIPLYYAFSKDVPDATVQAFQQALDIVKTDTREKGYSEYEQILYRYLGVGCVHDERITKEDVMNLVNSTVAAFRENVSDTVRRINSGEAPYRDTENRALYVFVFDTNVTSVAQANNPQLVGLNRHGKTDVTGKPYRDEFVNGALKNGSVWVDYVFTHPVEPGLFNKTAYCRSVRGSDGKTYIVVSGYYTPCA
jgi:polar amino acid transport system substrate-binding protein